MSRTNAQGNTHRAKLALICLLTVLSAAYLGKGFWVEIFRSGGRWSGAADLWRRWLEQQYIFRGQNPYTVTANSLRGYADPMLAVPADVDYPPWSYFSGLVFFWPGWPQVRIWFGLIDLLGLVYVVSFVIRFARRGIPIDRILLVLSVTSIAAFCTTIGTGNYGVIVLALLAGSLEAEEARHSILAGLLLGLAMLKPNMSGPFLLIPLVRARLRILFAAGAYLVIASAAVWIITGTDPFTMLGQMLRAGGRFTSADAGLLTALISSGVPYRIATPLLAAICLAIFGPLLFRYRNAEPIVLFAIAATFSRLWTYNQNHSNMILVFVLLALWRTAIERQDFRTCATFLAMAASLWIPATVSALRIVQGGEILIWSLCLASLLLFEKQQNEQRDLSFKKIQAVG
jgi:hypothetical protein